MRIVLDTLTVIYIFPYSEKANRHQIVLTHHFNGFLWRKTV